LDKKTPSGSSLRISSADMSPGTIVTRLPLDEKCRGMFHFIPKSLRLIVVRA